MKAARINQRRKDALLKAVIGINDRSKQVKKLSHEMMAYLAIDFLVNIERDTSARVKYGHLPIANIIAEMENKYRTEMIDHYEFFSSVEDNLK